MSTETVNDQGVKNLVYACVVRAIIDYEKALLNESLTREIGGFTHAMAVLRMREIEAFFESDLCFLMTQVDGDKIIYACKQRVKDPKYDPDRRFRPFARKT